MAEHFKEAGTCLVCLANLENPIHLKCGYVCCLHCMKSLRKEPHGEDFLCPLCPVVSQKSDIKYKLKLGELVSKTRELEPHLRTIVQRNPWMQKFQEDMTFDVDTANEFLIITDDLRSVQCGTIKQKLNVSAEKFSYSACILGSSQFTHGRHYWKVGMGRNKEWVLELCKETVHQQKEIILSMEFGF